LDEILEGPVITEYIRLCRQYQTGNVEARAYILFYKQRQSELNQAKSSFEICQLNSKNFGLDWKTLSPEKKAVNTTIQLFSYHRHLKFKSPKKVFLKEGEEQRRLAYEDLKSLVRRLSPADREDLNRRLREKIRLNPFLYETSVMELFENLCQTVTHQSNN